MSQNVHTILVVDPDERSYKAFESALGASNSVLFVPNGKTAIDFPVSHAIDIVFVSHKLNGTDGMHFLGTFKKRFPSIPVVLIADKPEVDEVITAYRSGARELLVKPIDEKELVAVTRKILGLIANKKPKRRWFLPAKKKVQTDKSDKNNNDHIKKNSEKSKAIKKNTVVESEADSMINSMPFAEMLLESDSNQLMFDAPNDPPQLDKKTHSFEIKQAAYPLIKAFFFGPFQVFVNNRPIENWPSKKGKSIFAYLLLHHKKKIFRDVLMDLTWRKSDPDSARNCLNVTIHGLRRELQNIDPETEYILFKDECYYFNPEVEIRIDVDAFRSIWRKAQSIEHMQNLPAAISEYERAASIYRGDFLENELYDGWSSLDQENLKEVYLVILDKISENFMFHQNHRKAIRVCEKILEKDNCWEDIYRRLIVCYYRVGQRDKSLKLFRKCTRVLKDELEVKLASSTIELYKKIKENEL